MSDAHEEQRCEGPGLCPECNQEAATEAFEGSAGKPAERCPACGQEMPDQPVRMTEAVRHSEGFWSDLLHPRAPAGSSAGGQFSSGGGGGSKGKAAAKGKKGAKTNHSRAAKKQHGTLGLYAGYGSKNGSPQVKAAQAALNHLGFKDSAGHALKLDGKLGPKTTAAIKAAQKRMGVPVTGRITAAFLKRLTGKQKTTRPKVAHPAAKSPAHKPAAKPAPKPAAKKPTTTHISIKEADASQPYGDVTYADTGFQADKKKRYPVDTADHVRSAWSYINQSGNAAKYSAADLKTVRGRIMTAAKKLGVTISEKSSEAFIAGKMAYGELRDTVEDAVRGRLRSMRADPYAPVSCYVVDLTDTDAVYMAGDEDDLYQCSYAVDNAGEVTLGDPVLVVKTYQPAPKAMADEEAAETPEEEAAEEGDDLPDGGMDEADLTEAADRIEGRVMEAKGADTIGGRVFEVRIIKFGRSKNARNYPAGVMQEAAPLYEGSKAYDHHRTEAELKSSTINGLVGYYKDVQAKPDGLYGDLHLLPGATHAAEAMDATVAAQEQGLPPLIGISHDVMAYYRPVVEGGRRLQEATQITKVNSADLVADPAAGGQATRMVAGGIEPGTLPEKQEDNVPPTKEDVLGALAEATEEELAGVGLGRITEADEEETEEEQVVEATSVASPKTGWLAQAMIREKVKAGGLPEALVESVTEVLPDRVTEADVDAHLAGLKAVIGTVERAGLVPSVARIEVTQESTQKKIDALDAFFAGDYSKGYRSFKEAFADFTGKRPKSFDEDFNRTVLRESMGAFESGRALESADSTTWNLVLGDSITRRLVAEYSQPSLSTWRQVVSSVVPISDFRTQRIDRLGGYGVLPAVNQGAPYQPLTTPANEEVTYAISKRGGTEDITLEMIANDDVRAIAKIPVKLGLAAAQTLFRFVWDLLRTNPTIYDGNALFASHNNDTASAALNQSNLSLARAAMRAQTAYGDTTDILSLVPKTLVVPSSQEEEAWQLVTSAVANPAPSGTQGSVGAANTPNIHQGMSLIVVDYFPGATGTASANKWYVVADPSMCPTIEMGFYQGRENPELFTQSDPSVGSMFDADKITYKIRHIYSGAVLDFRGFYRNGIP